MHKGEAESGRLRTLAWTLLCYSQPIPCCRNGDVVGLYLKFNFEVCMHTKRLAQSAGHVVWLPCLRLLPMLMSAVHPLVLPTCTCGAV